MELILEQGLPHQQKAISSVVAALDKVTFSKPVNYFENPKIDLDDIQIQKNIQFLQTNLPQEYRGTNSNENCLHLDIKMETGTGKTYVYTQTIYELHKKHGLNKFIIAVPSLAIKSGTYQFIDEPYVKRHFKDACGYGTDVEVLILESPKNKKKGHSYFPYAVEDFVKGSNQLKNKIFILIINMQLFSTSKNSMLFRNDYDYGTEGFYRPYDAIKATNPVIIIDEPHRFKRSEKTYQTLLSEIAPQIIIRYGATFPNDNKTKSGKDYQNLIYNLDACDSFNQGLIKGIAKEHLNSISNREEYIKIVDFKKNDYVSLHYYEKGKKTKTYDLKPGDSLAQLNDSFEGITIQEIDKNEIVFSNGIHKNKGEKIDVDIYMTSYQDQMMKLALQRHFETERENFNRNNKIKTLALFFIDDISSYRNSNDGKIPYLKNAFEHLLQEQINNTISLLSPTEIEYKRYLQASLENISACHAGYFAKDNDDSDEKIAQEITEILHGKKELLSFYKKDGTYNTRRFLFSKWTLKEGWDNPNVFTIAKLRSSGSENSKLQEVGRGLRLPVDENGNRISNESFKLNYIVDFTEADFAERLVNEINKDVIKTISVISAEKITFVANKLGKDPNDLFIELLTKKYVDMNRNIITSNRESFFAEYPDFEEGLSQNKIIDINKSGKKEIKIRKAKFNELKELWNLLNQRYMLAIDKSLNNNLEQIVFDIFKGKNGEKVFSKLVLDSSRSVIASSGNNIEIQEETGFQFITERQITYNEFLKQIMNATNIPISILHKGFIKFVSENGKLDKSFINETSALNFITQFIQWKNENLQGRFSYKKCDYKPSSTTLTNSDGTPRDLITQGLIGTKIANGVPCDKYLYDTIAYDSPLEKENILANIDSVVVYGKIPRTSIAIPVITGGTYSPDFMYVVNKKDGKKELNIIVETKDVEGKDSLRGEEKIKIDCASIFFKQLEEDGYEVKFHTQINNKKMIQIINEVIS